MRIVWVYGPPGVGKSVTGWALLRRLAESGESVAYVDIDQLGMVYPDPPGDEYADRLKGRALAAVASCHDPGMTLVVSGVLDPDFLWWYDEQLAPFSPTFVRLTASVGTLRGRLAARADLDEDEVAERLAEARRLEVIGLPHARVDTGSASVAQVVDEVWAAGTGQPSAAAPTTASTGPTGVVSGRALLVTGVTPVGKSTAAWAAFARLREKGIRAGFLDLRQLGLRGREGGRLDHELQARVVGAVWPELHAAGAEVLLLNGDVPTQALFEGYAQRLGPGTSLVGCRLVADEPTLIARAMTRQVPSVARLAGDHLAGLPQAELAALGAASYQRQARLGCEWRGATLDTSALTAEQTADELLGLLTPRPGRGPI